MIGDIVREHNPVVLYALKLCSRWWNNALAHWEPTLLLTRRCESIIGGFDSIVYDYNATQYVLSGTLHNYTVKLYEKVQVAWDYSNIRDTVYTDTIEWAVSDGALTCRSRLATDGQWRVQKVTAIKRLELIWKDCRSKSV